MEEEARIHHRRTVEGRGGGQGGGIYEGGLMDGWVWVGWQAGWVGGGGRTRSSKRHLQAQGDGRPKVSQGFLRFPRPARPARLQARAARGPGKDRGAARLRGSLL